MKVLKFKNSDDAVVIADEVVTPQPTKIKIINYDNGKKSVFKIDEYGKETLKIGGTDQELEVVDATGTLENGKEYEVKAGKLVEKVSEKEGSSK